MGNFQGGGERRGGFRGGNGGGNRGGGFRGGNGGGRDREVSMHKAVCDECHKSCEVPFRPSGDKPVYCSDCFSSKREGEDRAPRRDFGDRGPKRDFSRPAPSFAKPIVSNDDTSKKLTDISTKLDRLISAIEKLAQPKVAEVAKPVAKVEAKKAPVAKAPVKKVIAKKVVTKKKK